MNCCVCVGDGIGDCDLENERQRESITSYLCTTTEHAYNYCTVVSCDQLIDVTEPVAKVTQDMETENSN